MSPQPAATEATDYRPERPSAGHLVELPGTDWAVWREFALRGAGFPLADLEALAASELAAHAERVLDEEATARARATEAAREALAQAGDDRAAHKRAKRLLRRAESDAAVADSRGDGARHAYDAAYADAEAAVRARLRVLASDPRFREAVLWQNRQAVHTALDPFLADDRARASRRDDRVRQRLLASYLQRYCAKNDTIGFFGPACWGRFADDGPALRLLAGREVVARRRVYFESWCVDAVGEALSRRPDVRPWIAPRVPPYLAQDGDRLRLPGAAPVVLGRDHARLLAECDGRRTARAIAERLVADGAFARADDVYALLEMSVQSGLVTWTLQGPLELHPEQRLADRLSTVGDPAARAEALADLNALTAARDAVAAAAGDAERLDRALAGLEDVFTRLTGVAATRRPGETYAARTLVYEDCPRDVEITLGPAVLHRLAAPLALVLAAARWATNQLARRFRAELERAYAEESAHTGDATVDLVSLLFRSRALSGDEKEGTAIVRDVQSGLQERWARVLRLPPGAREVRFRSADLRGRVDLEFPDEGGCWRWPRYVSPDVMVAAADAEAVRRGEFRLVLGEVHLLNTLTQSALTAQHPRPADLLAALEGDCPRPAVLLHFGKRGAHARTTLGLYPEKDYVYETSAEGSGQARVLAAGELVVERAGSGLAVRTRDGRARFELLEFFGHICTYNTRTLRLDPLSLPAAGGHGPRVVVDGVVLARERWQFPAGALAFASEAEPPGRFLAARRWARAHGLPRRLFYRVPVETKPCYLDLDAPLFVELCAKLVRRAAEEAGPDATVTFSEMSPGFGEAWLEDGTGRRYTSELRIAALPLEVLP